MAPTQFWWEIGVKRAITHIINQTIFNLDIRILTWCSWCHRLLIFHNKTDFFVFWKFKYPVSQSVGFDPLCTPSFLIDSYKHRAHIEFIHFNFLLFNPQTGKLFFKIIIILFCYTVCLLSCKSWHFPRYVTYLAKASFLQDMLLGMFVWFFLSCKN
jgi:hypothetical protein